ncbi:MAG: type II secretion system F family protein [Deltaproteobacteria bacterium]|nr:type II secretion system F family protein [Deltaproteobacteria bacterium]
MPVYQYKAYNDLGRPQSGELEASSLKDARERLRKNGLYPKDLAVSMGRKQGIARIPKRVSLNELSVVTCQLSTLLSSGAVLLDALAILISETHNRALKTTLIDIKDRVSGGSSLALSFAAHPRIFSEMYCRMVEAAEESGTLDKVLIRLSDLMQARARINEKTTSALIYPLIMTIVGVSVLSFLLIFVIPKITRIFEENSSALPFITVLLLFMVDIFKNLWHVLAISAAGLIWGIRLYIKKPGGKALKDRLLLKIPYLSNIILIYYAATFSRTLGSLLESGVPILKAIDMTRKVLNHASFDLLLHKSQKDITEGGSLSTSIRGSHLVPGLLIHMMAIGERSGELDGLLLKAAESYEKEFELSVTRALTLLEPMLILIMGVAVGFIVLAILLPIFQLSQVVR